MIHPFANCLKHACYKEFRQLYLVIFFSFLTPKTCSGVRILLPQICQSYGTNITLLLYF